jgi:hypothetical protein
MLVCTHNENLKIPTVIRIINPFHQYQKHEDRDQFTNQGYFRLYIPLVCFE